MGVGNRPAVCASCGKRLNYKSWYYRNGKHFCKKRCWVTETQKTTKEASEKSSAKPEPAKEAPAAS